MPVIIKPLTEDKLSETIQVAIRAFGDECLKDAEIDFPSTFTNHKRPFATLIALQNDKVRGTVQCAHAYLTPHAYTISWLSVDPAFQKQGIGKQLLTEACDYIEKIFMKGDKGSILLTAHFDFKFYERYGFIKGPDLHFNEPLMIKSIKGN